jgi:hypothetical protein
MNSRRKHTSPKNKEKKNGWDPPSSTHMGAANCRAALGHIDRQIVAWAVARGRRAQGHRLRQKKAQVRHIADLILNLKMRSSNYVKFNKWRKYGITIRLHSLGHRRMDRGATRLSCKLLLDLIGYRHGNSYKGKPGRGYFPNNVSSRIRSWNMDKKIFFDGGQRYGSWNEGLQMQRGLRSKVQIYPKMDQGYRKLVGGKIKCQINLCSWFEKRSRKLLLSTIVRIVLLRPLRSSILCVAAEMVGPLIKWKKLNLEMLSWTSLSSMANMLHSAGKILETQTSFPPDPGREIAWGFFVTIIINNRIRPQAHN